MEADCIAKDVLSKIDIPETNADEFCVYATAVVNREKHDKITK